MFGQGVAVDEREGVAWYRRAAEQGNSGGQFGLGMAYAIGAGVPQDYVDAHKWLNLAASRGHDRAREQRDNVAGEMTREQLAEAQRRAREWFENNR